MYDFTSLKHTAPRTTRTYSTAIDFPLTAKACVARYGAIKHKNRNFGGPVVSMADAALGMYWNEDEMKGVERCLAYQISRLKWRDSFGLPFPFLTRSMPLFFLWLSEHDRKVCSHLAKSLILNIVVYRNGPYKLSDAELAVIWSGFQQVCYWVERSMSIDPKENELIRVLSMSEVQECISVKSLYK